MKDLYQYWGGDVASSATGDLLAVDGTVAGQQRLLRRLLTNPAEYDAAGNQTQPPDYIFHPDYGAGLPRWVGKNVDIPKIRALIRGQIFLETAVARSPAPQIDVVEISSGVSVSIRYADAQSRQPVFLSFNVNR